MARGHIRVGGRLGSNIPLFMQCDNCDVPSDARVPCATIVAGDSFDKGALWHLTGQRAHPCRPQYDRRLATGIHQRRRCAHSACHKMPINDVASGDTRLLFTASLLVQSSILIGALHPYRVPTPPSAATRAKVFAGQRLVAPLRSGTKSAAHS